MSYDPYRVVPAVLVIAAKDGKVLMVERQNTGYRDGWYALPGGHLEAGESLQEGAAREFKEEVGLITSSDNLELIHIYHNDQDDTGRAYIGFIFRARTWEGEPAAGDDKIGKLGFFGLDELPQKTIPYLLPAIKLIDATPIKITFTDWSGANKL